MVIAFVLFTEIFKLHFVAILFSAYTDLCSSSSVRVTTTGSSANKTVFRIKSFAKVHSVVLLIKHRDELCLHFTRQGCQRSGINPEIRMQTFTNDIMPRHAEGCEVFIQN
jgi:hypothetical protein